MVLVDLHRGLGRPICEDAVLRQAIFEEACEEPRRHQTCHFRKRATSAPAEGPACRLGFAGRCEFPLRTPQAHKWHVYRNGTFGAA